VATGRERSPRGSAGFFGHSGSAFMSIVSAGSPGSYSNSSVAGFQCARSTDELGDAPSGR
jgi:hypothetical protein